MSEIVDPPPSRRLPPLSGVFNLRDLGGYRTVDGRVTVWRRVLRADGLHRCEPSELAALPVRFRTVLDLRTDAEREERGAVDASQVSGGVVHLPLIRNTWEDDGHHVDVPAEEFLAARYREMLDSGATAIRNAFELLADPGSYPLVFHCTAGKDRTGVLAGLLLSALGVPDETIAHDYGMTRDALEPFTAWLFERYPEARDRWDEIPTVFLDSPPEAMARFLVELRSEFGSPGDYLTAIGVTDDVVEDVRHALLVDASQATAPAARSDEIRSGS